MSGALVFVDAMHAPTPHPFGDGKHFVVFDNRDKQDLFRKLDYYLKHPHEARRIARAGYVWSLKYHRAVSRADYSHFSL